MTAAEMLLTLAGWRDAGWLRSLDLALARWLHETDTAAPPSLLLATALVAQMEGRGHSGLPLDGLGADAPGLLAWPPESAAALQAALADWPADAAARRGAWQGLAALEFDPVHDGGSSPLVVCGELLQLRRYWRYEARVAAQVRQRVAAAEGPADAPVDLPAGRPAAAGDGQALDTDAVRVLLGRLFEPVAADAPTDWQAVACTLALRARLTLITGGPGTGKTYTAARLLVLLQSLHAGPQPLRVALAAPTGKAAARLRQSIGGALQGLEARLVFAPGGHRGLAPIGPARTLHSLLGTQPGTRRFRHDAANPLDVDLLLVDEASMVHLEMMAQLLDALPARARVVLLGDKDQLASVEAGAVMGDLCDGADEGGERGGYRPATAEFVHRLTGCRLPASTLGNGPALAQQTVVLRKSHRFGGPIGQLALAVNRGDTAAALQWLRAGPGGPVGLFDGRDAAAAVALALQGRPGAEGGYRAYLDRLARRPPDLGGDVGGAAFDDWAKAVLRAFDGFRMLCAVRDGAWGVVEMNRAVERGLAQAGLLARRGEWYEGRPVMVTRNDPGLGVFNGDIGIALRVPAGDALRCHFLEGDALRSVSVARLADVETAFVMTVHKSQGSEFDHVVLVLPDEDVPVLTRELLYTAITRARHAFTLLAPQASVLAKATGRLTRRVSGLKRALRG